MTEQSPLAKAQRAYEASLYDKGLRHITVRLGPEYRAKLAALKARHGSNKAAIEAGIDLAHRFLDTPTEPKDPAP